MIARYTKAVRKMSYGLVDTSVLHLRILQGIETAEVLKTMWTINNNNEMFIHFTLAQPGALGYLISEYKQSWNTIVFFIDTDVYFSIQNYMNIFEKLNIITFDSNC